MISPHHQDNSVSSGMAETHSFSELEQRLSNWEDLSDFDSQDLGNFHTDGLVAILQKLRTIGEWDRHESDQCEAAVFLLGEKGPQASAALPFLMDFFDDCLSCQNRHAFLFIEAIAETICKLLVKHREALHGEVPIKTERPLDMEDCTLLTVLTKIVVCPPSRLSMLGPDYYPLQVSAIKALRCFGDYAENVLERAIADLVAEVRRSLSKATESECLKYLSVLKEIGPSGAASAVPLLLDILQRASPYLATYDSVWLRAAQTLQVVDPEYFERYMALQIVVFPALLSASDALSDSDVIDYDLAPASSVFFRKVGSDLDPAMFPRILCELLEDLRESFAGIDGNVRLKTKHVPGSNLLSLNDVRDFVRYVEHRAPARIRNALRENGPFIQAALEWNDPLLRRYAAKNIGGAQAVSGTTRTILFRALGDRDRRVRNAARAALERVEPDDPRGKFKIRAISAILNPTTSAMDVVAILFQDEGWLLELKLIARGYKRRSAACFPEEIKDMIHEFLIWLLERRLLQKKQMGFKASFHEKFGGWISQIFRHYLSNEEARRKRIPRQQRLIGEIGGENADPAETVEPEVPFSRQVLEFIDAELADPWRSVLWNRFVEKRTLGELAIEMGKSKDQVWRLQQRAVEIVRTRFARFWDAD